MKSRFDINIFLKELGLSGIGVNIGANKDNFSEVLVKDSPLNKIFLLNHWAEVPFYPQEIQDANYETFSRVMSGFGERVKIVRKNSFDGVKDFPDDYFDFIYIDNFKRYDEVKIEMELWYPKLRNGGLFSGYNYFNFVSIDGYGVDESEEVKRAVDDFAKQLGKNVIEIPGEKKWHPFYPSWYFLK